MKSGAQYDIVIDFDGTVVTHEFPEVGKDIGAVPVLKELVANGHNLILFTMRSDKHDNSEGNSDVPEVHNGNFLTDAVKWFEKHEIPLYGVQVNPTQHTWTTSPKAYGQIIIDDAALGCPLKQDYIPHPDGYYVKGGVPVGRPYVCWETVRKHLQEKGLL